MKHTGKWIIGVISVIVCLVVVGVLAVYYIPNKWGAMTAEEVVIVTKDETGAEIGEELFEKGLIKSETAFRIALRVNGVMDKLQQGYYQIPDNVSLHEVISILQKGRVKSVKVTIPEGYTIQEIGTLLENKGLVKKADFLAEAKSYVPYQYMYGPTSGMYRVEGFLFPSTYDIPVNSSAKDILELLAKEMNAQLTPDMRAQIKDQKLSVFQFITLASLVEKEAKFDEDRVIIASVFKQRLDIGMPLQSCASIQYILGYPKAQLSIEDTAIQSPYNTYLNKGLPPGPIANPGIKSMEAVLKAEKTSYLFFVADKDGHHHFSKTYEEHLKEVERIYGK